MKNINLDTNKFKLLLERMDGKITLSEVNKKIMLIEGVIDDIIKAARRAPIDISGVFSPQSINIINKSLDEFFNVVDKILVSLKSGKSDLNSLKNSLKPEDIISSNSQWRKAMARVVDQLNLGNRANVPEIKKNIFDFINSDPLDGSIKLNTDNLSQSQRDLILKYQGLNKEYVDFIKNVEKIQKLTKNLNPDSNLDDVVGQLLSDSGIVSLEDIKKIFDDLEDYNTRYPNDELTDIYDIFKKRFGLTSKNGDEIITTFKKSLRDNDVYKTVDLSLRKKIAKWFVSKLSKKTSDVNFELGKKVDWDNSLIYYNKKEDSFYIIVTKNKEELDQVYKQVSDQGFKPRKTDGSNGSKGFGKEDLIYTENNSKVKFYLTRGFGLSIVGGIGYIIYSCYNKSKELDKEAIKRAEKENQGKKYEVKDKSFVRDVWNCGGGTVEDISVLVIDAGITFFNDVVRPKFLELEGSILLWLDKKCGRPSPDEPCQKCLDCDKDFSIDEIKQINVGNVNIGKYMSIIKSTIGGSIKDKYPDQFEGVMAEIEQQWGNGMVSKFLTKDGKPLPIDEMVKIMCNQHSKKCVAEHYNKLLSEIMDSGENQDCTNIDFYVDERISILEQYNKRGMLNWGASEKAVDISINSNGVAVNTITTDDGNTPFNGVSSVDQFLQRLKDLKNNIKEIICNGSGGTTEDEVIELDFLPGSPLELMKELWDSGEVRLNCDEWRTELTIKRKNKLKITMGTVFNDYFVKVFPNINWYGEDWDEAFNYWWDKQRSMCNITN